MRRWRARLPRGFTLIELMVAIGLTMLTIAGLTSLYLGFKVSTGTQERLGTLAANERQVLSAIIQAAAVAGYFPDPTVAWTRSAALPAAPGQGQVPMMLAGQAVAGTGTGSGVLGQSDTLTMRFLSAGGDGVADCAGRSAASGALRLVVATFRINADGELLCQVDGGATEVLAVGVYSLWVQHGVDTDGDGSVDAYLNGPALSASGHGKQVKSLRLTLRFVDTISRRNPQTPIEAMPTDMVHVVMLPNALR